VGVDENRVGDDLTPLLADAAEAAEVARRKSEEDAGEDVSRETRDGACIRGRCFVLDGAAASARHCNCANPWLHKSFWLIRENIYSCMLTRRGRGRFRMEFEFVFGSFFDYMRDSP
jgi:hypothetical protein